ncbi:MAG: diguanylate cyclase [Pseudomonadota bacterium]
MVNVPFGAAPEYKGRRRRLVFGFGALVILALLFAAIVANAVTAASQRRAATGWQVHTLEVLVTAESLKAAANMAIRGERGYLITGDARFLKSYRNGRREAVVLMARLAAQTRDNTVQQRHLADLKARITRYSGVLAQAIELRRTGQIEAAAEIVRSGAGMEAIDSVLGAIDAIEHEEQRLLAERSAVNERANAVIDWYNYAVAIAGLIFLVVAALAGASTLRAQNRTRRMAEQLRLSATTDELTGLANRRAFLHALEIELARARRSGAPLSVAVADVDFFKRVNDKHGHGGGDEVLRTLARIAEQTMRTGDLVGRLGGEEFAILMPDTDEIQARIACERLRGAVSGRKIRLASGKEVPVTLSTGVALLSASDDRDRLVGRADEALYQAKEGGRNQVRMAA